MKQSLKECLENAAKFLELFEFDAAEPLYHKVLRRHPDNASALMGVALLYNRTGKTAAALEVLKKIWQGIENSPPERRNSIPPAVKARVLEQMGLAMQLQGNPDKAIALYSEANHVHASTQLQLRISYLGNPALQAAVQVDMDKAQALVAAQDSTAAIEAYRRVLAVYPTHDRALHELGELFRKRSDFQQAQPLIQQALVMQPMRAEYQNTLGLLFQQRCDYAKATLYFLRALEIDPRNSVAQCNLGVAYKHLNRLNDAALAYHRAIEMNPRMAEAYNNLGNLQRITGDFEAAKASLEQAIAIRPDYLDATRNLESLLLRMEQISMQERSRKKPSVKKASPGSDADDPDADADAEAEKEVDADPAVDAGPVSVPAAKAKPRVKAKAKPASAPAKKSKAAETAR